MVEGNGAPACQQSWNSDAGRVRDSGGHFTSFDKERDAAIEEHLERGHSLGGEVVEGRPPAANDEQKSGFEITDPSDMAKLAELDARLLQLGAKQGESATFTSKAEDFSYTVTVEPSGIIEITLSGQRALASSIRFSKDVSTAAQQWQVVSNYDTETGVKILPDSNQVHYLLSLLDPTRLEAASQTVDQTIVHAETQAEPTAKVENPLAGIPKSPENRYSRLLKILKNSGKPVWNALADRLNVVATYKGGFITALTDGAGEPEELRTAIEAGLKTAFDQLLTNEVLSQELQKALDRKYQESFKILNDSERSQLIGEIVASFLDTEWKPPARQGFLSKMRGWFASKVKPALSELLISDADQLIDAYGVPEAGEVKNTEEEFQQEVQPLEEKATQAEDSNTISDRIQANEIKLEQAKIATDSSAILQLNREIAADKEKLAKLQQEVQQPATEKPKKQGGWWQKFFPGKAPKSPDTVAKQTVESGEMASSARQQEIEAKLKAEHGAREEEKRLSKLDLEYVSRVTDVMIKDGTAKSNRAVGELILALAQHAIDTFGELGFDAESEKKFRKLIEKAKIHPNAEHAQERPFESEQLDASQKAVEASSLSSGKKEFFKKALQTTGTVLTGAAASAAFGVMGVDPGTRITLSSAGLLTTAALGETVLGTYVRGGLAGMSENEALPAFLRKMAQGASGIAHGVQARSRFLFAFFSGALGESVAEVGYKLLNETQASAVVVTPPAGEIAASPINKILSDEVLRTITDATSQGAQVTPDAAVVINNSFAQTAEQLSKLFQQSPQGSEQLDTAIKAVQQYFTPERMHQIREVVEKFDVAAPQQVLTLEQTNQLGESSKQAVASINTLMDQVSGMTADQRAAQITPWVNQVTATLKNFNFVPPAR